MIDLCDECVSEDSFISSNWSGSAKYDGNVVSYMYTPYSNIWFMYEIGLARL